MTKLAAIQTCCDAGNVDTNVAKAAELIHDASIAGAEFVCLPELFSTGAVGDKIRELAEPIPGPTTQKLVQVARKNGVYVVAGIAEKDVNVNTLHNASVIISPEGTLLKKYRKIFLYLV
mgnify:CR=1 FL=1